MTSISITLIRRTHDDFSIDNVESLSIIRLDNQGINCIDNLEVFSHIRELYLSNNEIEKIENIDFLDNLEFLDLSNNKITSQNLITSIALLPRNLKTLNIADNPCSIDESALLILQDKCPNLNIIVGVYNGGEIIQNSDNLGGEDASLVERDSGKFFNQLILHSVLSMFNFMSHFFHYLYFVFEKGDEDDDNDDDHPLNADEVLKALVERKCRLQSMEVFNSKDTVEVFYSY
jgi:Leucine-rich repeat (LRR) protein